MRYFIEFAYKGTNYHGWQIQPNAITVQETLTNALSTILQIPIELVGAGRTDTGVHASQMFAHFDYENNLENGILIFKLNSFLPKDIAVRAIHKVAFDAHARFDAKSRTYHYYIHSAKNPFQSDDSWYFSGKLNLDAMNKACEILKATTNFECFSKVHTDVATFDCEVTEAKWEKTSQNELLFTITANRFLRNMVRAIVGTMINIGLEKVSLLQFIEILESNDRKKAGFSAPAHGLFLTKVNYLFLK
jgi:tRNA pseudouridine38-40 synthase